MRVSIVIRTLNEGKYLDELLLAVSKQDCIGYEVEVVIVDSGSTDGTLEIAKRHKARIVHISPEEFTFGRSLNLGCMNSTGEVLVFVSGHCIPTNGSWLFELVNPIAEGLVSYCYGKQIGIETTKFSENSIFEKYFPDFSVIPQKGYFCNNANSAIKRECWESHQFNEKITGLEDMYLAKDLVENGLFIGYSSNSVVYHIHNESWKGTMRRYEREAVALRWIMPEVTFGFWDFVTCFPVSVISDTRKAVRQNWKTAPITSIVKFRLAQYLGSLRGSALSEPSAEQAKIRYYYPRVSINE